MAEPEEAADLVASLAAGGVDVVAQVVDPEAAGEAAAAHAADLVVIDVPSAPAAMVAGVGHVRRCAPGVEVHVVVRGERPHVVSLAESAGADLVIKRGALPSPRPGAHERANAARIERAIAGEGLSPVYQAIVNLHTGRVVGLEAMARFDEMPGRTPEDWFVEAESLGLRHELEVTTVRAALDPVGHFPTGWFVAVDLSPDTLAWAPFRAVADTLPVDRLWLELAAHAVVGRRRRRLALPWSGTRRPQLALDGAGASAGVLHAVFEIAPDVVKVAPELVRDIDHQPGQQAIVATLIDVARQAGAVLVADGVTSQAEAVTAERLGIRLAQGPFLDRPEPLDPSRLRALRRR
jgi:EAL domain-containing protein (putative c-di-GMP-specific phosphodiesterase class I)